MIVWQIAVMIMFDKTPQIKQEFNNRIPTGLVKTFSFLPRKISKSSHVKMDNYNILQLSAASQWKTLHKEFPKIP